LKGSSQIPGVHSRPGPARPNPQNKYSIFAKIAIQKFPTSKSRKGKSLDLWARPGQPLAFLASSPLSKKFLPKKRKSKISTKNPDKIKKNHPHKDETSEQAAGP
jgi:hypothetical protein